MSVQFPFVIVHLKVLSSNCKPPTKVLKFVSSSIKVKVPPSSTFQIPSAKSPTPFVVEFGAEPSIVVKLSQTTISSKTVASTELFLIIILSVEIQPFPSFKVTVKVLSFSRNLVVFGLLIELLSNKVKGEFVNDQFVLVPPTGVTFNCTNSLQDS